MLKTDLLTGMLVTYRNGMKGVVFLDTREGHMICNLGDGCFVAFRDLSSDLKCTFSNGFDIMKVEEFSSMTFTLRSVFAKSLSCKTAYCENSETIFTRNEEKERLDKIVADLQQQLAETQSKLSKL